MFGIGPLEMAVVAVLALMLFSPRELPKMLRTVAKFWGQLRATADEFKETIMTADGVDEIQELVKGTKGQIRQVETDARRELMKARAEMRKAQQKLLKTSQAKQEIRQRELFDNNKKAEATEGETSSASSSELAADSATGDDGPVASPAPHEVAHQAADQANRQAATPPSPAAGSASDNPGASGSVPPPPSTSSQTSSQTSDSSSPSSSSQSQQSQGAA